MAYSFSKRGAHFSDDATSTDLSVNYSFKLPAFGTELEFFVIPQITNIFNGQVATTPDTTVYTRYSGSIWPLFNPFTTAPKECQ